MRTLVISDIHENIGRAKKIIKSVPHDKLVLTGDYFDNYDSPAKDAKNTAKWLKEDILHNPNAIAILGNHDTSYIFNNGYFRCSGFSFERSQLINDVLNEDDRAKFVAYHIDQGYALSHAGLTNERWKEYSAKFIEQSATETKLEFFDRVMKVISKEAIDAARSNTDTPLFAAGWDRGGIYRHGGINWVDWNSLSPIKGINQIVGHTIHRVPQVLIQKVGGGYTKQDITEYYELRSKSSSFEDNYVLSISYDIDTHLNHYAVIEDGNVDIFHIDTGLNLKDIKNIYLPESDMNGL